MDRKRTTLYIICAVAMVLIAVVFSGALRSIGIGEMSNKKAIARLSNYREGDMVDLDAYLKKHNYEAVGCPGSYVYRDGDRIISIQDYGDSVTVGDGMGTSQQYGLSSYEEIYVCRVSWRVDTEDPSVPSACDLNLSDDALAEIVRWVYR